MEARCESCTKGLCIWTRKHEQQKSINHFCFCLFLLNWAPLKWSGLGLLWAIFLTLLSVELKFILSIIKTISHVFLHDPSQKLLLELKFILPKHDYEICHCKGYTVLDCFKSGISVVHLVALGPSGFAWNPCIHLQRLLRPVHSHLVARLWMRMRMRMLMRTTGVQSEDQNRRLIWSGKNVWPTPRDSMQRTLCLICFLMIKGVHASCSGIWQWFSNLFPHDFSPFFSCPGEILSHVDRSSGHCIYVASGRPMVARTHLQLGRGHACGVFCGRGIRLVGWWRLCSAWSKWIQHWGRFLVSTSSITIQWLVSRCNFGEWADAWTYPILWQMMGSKGLWKLCRRDLSVTSTAIVLIIERLSSCIWWRPDLTPVCFGVAARNFGIVAAMDVLSAGEDIRTVVLWMLYLGRLSECRPGCAETWNFNSSMDRKPVPSRQACHLPFSLTWHSATWKKSVRTYWRSWNLTCQSIYIYIHL